MTKIIKTVKKNHTHKNIKNRQTKKKKNRIITSKARLHCKEQVVHMLAITFKKTASSVQMNIKLF